MLQTRCSWDKIKKIYSKQYVGLVNIVRNNKNEIVMADVACSTKESSYEDMLEQAINNDIYMIYTTEDTENEVGVYE